MIARRLLLVVAVAVTCMPLESLRAQVFEKLVMPGRVIEGHAEVEADCGACHDADSDAARASLCTSCHEDVGRDREAGEGFHGRFAAARDSECVACHTDHEGRDADIVNLHAGLFDHALTDFALGGKHAIAACTDCHRESEAYHEAPLSCGSCHSDEDVHDGKLGQDCGSCHSDVAWTQAEFDHAGTGYPLTGAHTATACADCHQNNQYENTPRTCNSCHAIDDVHAGSNGPQCQDCHSTATWQTIGFDHLAETGFALSDGHDNLACTDCHTREDFKDSFANGCVDCHKADDDHQGRNGADCGSCHQPTVWPDSLFDHGDTGFHLVEAHAELNCSSCHKAETAAEVDKTCSTCHAMDDSHGGQMTAECSACHTQTAWHTSVLFDHDLTSFPLTGLHAAVSCGGCHESNRFQSADAECASCHLDDDVHAGTLGNDCASCHTSNGWTITVFDHDVNTNFPLEGRHEGLACGDCHKSSSASAADVPSTCGGCHANDDVHDGQFGSDCGQCHNVNSFSEVDAL
ncbi:MAG: cytochrome c3 family protein [Pseudomonadota bacterium]